jgi:cell division protein ZapA (FtsZ GTPase activity inhibitor)
MSEAEKLVMMANMLHDALEVAGKNEKYNDNIQTRLDDLSYEVYKIKSNLNEIKYYLGG